MKFLKHIFSKLFIVTLLLFLQVGLITVFWFVLAAYFTPFMIFSMVLGVFTMLYIINKEQPAEFKIPWLMLIVLLPLFGLATYILFANPRISKWQTKRLMCVHKSTCDYLKPEKTREKLKQTYPKFYDIDQYLNKAAYGMGHFNNRVKYYSSGEEFFPDYLESLKSAKKFIFIEYFIIAEGSMWDYIHKILLEKVKEGVEVRVMYDDIGNSGLQPNEYYRKLRKEGILCYKFNSFKPFITGVYNYRDHRKITVIDGKVAYTGGLNIADEYINAYARLAYWKDSAVRVEGSAAVSFTAMFLQLYDMTSHKASDYDKYLNVEYETFGDEGYIYPFGDGPKPYYKEYVGENNFISILNKAERYVYITTPYLITDYALTNALHSAAMRGVDVRIITPHVPDKWVIYNITRSRFPNLLDAGVKIYEYTPGFIHAKSVVADDEFAFVGTINFDYRSLVHHFECGLNMYKSPCVKEIREDFIRSMNLSKELNKENSKQNILVKLVNSVLALLTPML